jgi:hypothetical protein
MQEWQCALSPPISLHCGDGDAAAAENIGGNIVVSDGGQQAHDMGTQVLSHASGILCSNYARHRC